MRWRIPLVLTLALFVAVGCDQQPTDPVEQPVATAPGFNFMNGPDMAGVVSRGDAYFVAVWDFTRDETEKEGEPWAVIMGMGIDDYHSSCGAGFDTVWDRQTVQEALELSMAQDMDVTVFPAVEFLGNYMNAPADANRTWYATCETTRIASGAAHGHKDDAPAGLQYHVNGTIDYMGDTYRLKWKVKFFGKDGMMRTMRIW